MANAALRRATCRNIIDEQDETAAAPLGPAPFRLGAFWVPKGGDKNNG